METKNLMKKTTKEACKTANLLQRNPNPGGHIMMKIPDIRGLVDLRSKEVMKSEEIIAMFMVHYLLQLLESRLEKGKDKYTAVDESDGNEYESKEVTYKVIQFPSTLFQATPLPSISAPQPQFLNLIKQKKPTGCKTMSRNAFQHVRTPLTPLSTATTASWSASSAISQSHPPTPTVQPTTSPINATTSSALTSAATPSAPTSAATPSAPVPTPLVHVRKLVPILLKVKVSFSRQSKFLKGFLPRLTLHVQWAEKAFSAACVVTRVNLASDKQVIKLITARGSRIHGKTYKWIQAKVETTYHFDGDGSKQAKKHNKDLYHTHSARNFSAFAYKDHKDWIGYAEHPSIVTLLGYIFKNGMGTVFDGYFKIISLKTLASLFTMVQATLTEWATGKCIKVQKFSEEEHRKFYEGYLKDLAKWDDMNPVVSTNIWKQMFNKARDQTCPKPMGEVDASHISGNIEDELRAQMEACTGDTESDASAS
ncbi:hypothetical protein BDP27DRAFT_1368109 [Rhodocollybia butyracea]|uniref:DUF6532 domain-containing protein n=1 Tax=Rhodocollybia butyracea TaxID=206335 RepID=A0A9P5U2B6_9AGAR|nr:hypothetical protein BDP27DRAFT_1368109 [Rhodocollybia butyracea]